MPAAERSECFFFWCDMRYFTLVSDYIPCFPFFLSTKQVALILGSVSSSTRYICCFWVSSSISTNINIPFSRTKTTMNWIKWYSNTAQKCVYERWSCLRRSFLIKTVFLHAGLCMTDCR